jgi:hypothetical protein
MGQTAKVKHQTSTPETSKPQPTYQPFSLLDHDEAAQITGTLDRAILAERLKQKTRGTPASSAIPEIMAGDVSGGHQPAIKLHFDLDKRSRKAFRAVFHSGFTGNIPSEIPWTDFLHAMVQMGFSAEKLHGSAWQFPSVKDGTLRPFQAHNPHSNSMKLPLAWARRIGRRLSRAYGWTSGMFE